MCKTYSRAISCIIAIVSLLLPLSAPAIAAGPGYGFSDNIDHTGMLRDRNMAVGISLRMPFGGQERETWRDTRLSFRVDMRGTYGAGFVDQPAFRAELPVLDLSMKLNGDPQSLALNGVEFSQFRMLNAAEDGTEDDEDGKKGGGINWWWVTGGTVVVLVGLGIAAREGQKNALDGFGDSFGEIFDKALFCVLHPKHPDCQ